MGHGADPGGYPCMGSGSGTPLWPPLYPTVRHCGHHCIPLSDTVATCTRCCTPLWPPAPAAVLHCGHHWIPLFPHCGHHWIPLFPHCGPLVTPLWPVGVFTGPVGVSTGLPGCQRGLPGLEVCTVYGSGVTASVESSLRQNAETSRIDLADLSKNAPRWKLSFSSRAGMKILVRHYFPRFVAFSDFALSFLGCFDRNPGLWKSRK